MERCWPCRAPFLSICLALYVSHFVGGGGAGIAAAAPAVSVLPPSAVVALSSDVDTARPTLSVI